MTVSALQQSQLLTDFLQIRYKYSFLKYSLDNEVVGQNNPIISTLTLGRDSPKICFLSPE